MYRRVISRETIDSRIGANLRLFRSYGGDVWFAEEEIVAKVADLGLNEVDLVVVSGMPWMVESKKRGLLSFDVRAAEAMNAIF